MQKEKKLTKKEIKQKLIDAIEEKAKRIEEYKATPTKPHLEKVVSELPLADNSAVLIVTFNPETKDMTFNGIKCKTSDIVAMAMYAMTRITQIDVAGVMGCVSTVARQEELNDCWVENKEEAVEVKDEN